MLKQSLKIITCNDPFFCFPALKIIYLPFLVQAQCRSEPRLPLNKAVLSWWHRTPQAVRVAFPRLVFPFPTLLQQAGCEPCALQPCGVVGQAGRACCGETGEGNLAGEEKESSAWPGGQMCGVRGLGYFFPCPSFSSEHGFVQEILQHRLLLCSRHMVTGKPWFLNYSVSVQNFQIIFKAMLIIKSCTLSWHCCYLAFCCLRWKASSNNFPLFFRF